MDNPLLPSVIDISPTDEEALKGELVVQSETSLLDLQRRKADIEARRQELDIDAKEENLEAIDWLNQRIYGLVSAVTQPEMLERVAGSTKTGKDLHELMKAAKTAIEIRDDLLEHTFDTSMQSGRKKKIAVAFQGQGVTLMVGVETNE